MITQRKTHHQIERITTIVDLMQTAAITLKRKKDSPLMYPQVLKAK
jgi:hypothetical protein